MIIEVLNCFFFQQPRGFLFKESLYCPVIRCEGMNKRKFQCEFPVRSSRGVLYSAVSTPSGLAGWFCDDVNIRNNRHEFAWSESTSVAHLLASKRDEFVRFQWEEEQDGDTFFEFRIKVDALTGDTTLVITDFAHPEDHEDERELWEAQVEKLRQVLGA
jgi:uncharacterized protein YndB with AHSA1/START domain